MVARWYMCPLMFIAAQIKVRPLLLHMRHPSVAGFACARFCSGSNCALVVGWRHPGAHGCLPNGTY